MTKRNIFYNTLYQLINLIIPIITAPYLSRVLGADGVGISSYGRAVAGYFVLFAMLGLNNYGNRTIALSKGDKKSLSETFWQIYLTQFISSLVVLAVYVVYVLQCTGDYRLVLLLNVIYVLSSLFDINWFFFGVGEFKLTATRNILIKIASTVLIFLLVKEKEDVNLYVAITATGFLIANLVLWVYLKKYVCFVRVSLQDCYKHIKPNLVLFIPALAVSVYKLMDKVMLGALSNSVQNGYYENTSNIVTIPLSVITALGTVMLPKISELVKNGDNEKVLAYNRDSIQLMLGASLPFSVGLICVADNFVPLYFGNDFIDSAIVLKLLAITCPFITIGNVVRTQFIIPWKKDNIYVQATILGAVLNFVINLILIPGLGAVGAAIGTIAAEISVALYQCIKVREQFRKIPVMKDNIVFLIASIIMGLAVNAVGQLSLSATLVIAIQVLVGVLIYFVLIVIYFYKFDKGRILHWLGMLKKR